jgi:uncharacterized membrane protein YcaP (DUF421 family)
MILNQMFTDLFVSGVPLAEKIVRSVVVYGFLIILLRVAGKRTLAQLTSFDLVVLLLLSNTVQNAIIGNDNSLVGGLLGAMVLVAANYVVVRALYKHKKADRAIEGSSSVLMHHGTYMDANMKHQLITKVELERSARKQGITRMSDIRVARLETGGVLTFELESPTEYEKRLASLCDRLERIEGLLERLEASGNNQEADA